MTFSIPSMNWKTYSHNMILLRKQNPFQSSPDLTQVAPAHLRDGLEVPPHLDNLPEIALTEILHLEAVFQEADDLIERAQRV
jgi:hypothetical protein